MKNVLMVSLLLLSSSAHAEVATDTLSLKAILISSYLFVCIFNSVKKTNPNAIALEGNTHIQGQTVVIGKLLIDKE